MDLVVTPAICNFPPSPYGITVPAPELFALVKAAGKAGVSNMKFFQESSLSTSSHAFRLLFKSLVSVSDGRPTVGCVRYVHQKFQQPYFRNRKVALLALQEEFIGFPLDIQFKLESVMNMLSYIFDKYN